MSINLYDGPDQSPWGTVQYCKMLCHGVFQVDTASHGGVMADRQIENDVLSPAARKCGFCKGGYRCFEEDCDAPVALRELMDEKLFTAPENEYFKPGEYSALIDQSLQRYHPKYWAACERSQHKSSIKSKLAVKPASRERSAGKPKALEER